MRCRRPAIARVRCNLQCDYHLNRRPRSPRYVDSDLGNLSRHQLLISPVLGLCVALGACDPDECKDSEVGTSWCEGKVAWACELGGGKVDKTNFLLEPEDCAQQGVDCIESVTHDGYNRKLAECGFANATCSESQRRFCIGNKIAGCDPDFDHPLVHEDCSAMELFCQQDVETDTALCSPVAERCGADAAPLCVEGWLLQCVGGAWQKYGDRGSTTKCFGACEEGSPDRCEVAETPVRCIEGLWQAIGGCQYQGPDCRCVVSAEGIASVANDP